jgi:leader peptidase (prepilin peptidase)/N-methyltransferase
VLPAVAVAAVAASTAGEFRAVLAGAALVAAYGVLAVLPRSGLGFGDVKLAGLLGVALGPLGWDAVVAGTALGFVLGGGVALLLLVAGRANGRTPIPFGPAMLAGAWLAAVAGL